MSFLNKRRLIASPKTVAKRPGWNLETAIGWRSKNCLLTLRGTSHIECKCTASSHWLLMLNNFYSKVLDISKISKKQHWNRKTTSCWVFPLFFSKKDFSSKFIFTFFSWFILPWLMVVYVKKSLFKFLNEQSHTSTVCSEKNQIFSKQTFARRIW